jgi:hypothetical protein
MDAYTVTFAGDEIKPVLGDSSGPPSRERRRAPREPGAKAVAGRHRARADRPFTTGAPDEHLSLACNEWHAGDAQTEFTTTVLVIVGWHQFTAGVIVVPGRRVRQEPPLDRDVENACSFAGRIRKK